MVPIGRREFVAASGLAAIAGCLARGNESEDEPGGNETDGGASANGDDGADGGEALPESLTTVLDSVPTEVGDVELRQFYAVAPDPDDRSNQSMMGAGSQQVGLDPDDVDRGLTAMYGEMEGTIVAFAGDFDAEDPEPHERAATEVRDGLVLTATTEGGAWETGLDAAETAADDPEVGIAASAPVEALFGPLTAMDFATGILIVDEALPEDVSFDTDGVQALGFGRDADVEAREETVAYVAVFEEGETPETTVIEELLRIDNDDETGPEDVDIETDDRRAMTTFTRDLPQSSLPDNSPDVHVGIVSESEADAVSLFVSGDESVDASNLEYRVDGERAEPPWDEDATLESDDRYEIDVQPMSLVSVLWIDPELDDVKQSLGSTVVGTGEAFQASYDHDAHELTIEYTVDRSLEPDRFEVVRRSDGFSSEETTPLSEHVDTLERGTEFLVSDLEYGEYVNVQMEVDDETDRSSHTVFWYNADPPGHFSLESEDGEHVLAFRTEETDVRAEAFRVLVDGEPADSQWSDVTETLTDGERLELDVAAGDTVTVEYVHDGDPVEVISRDVLPTTAFDFDVGESTVEITHDGGEAVDADSLAVHIYPGGDGRIEDAFEEYDTVEEGDSVTVELPDGDGSERLAVVVVNYDGQAIGHASVEDDGGTDQGSGSDATAGED